MPLANADPVPSADADLDYTGNGLTNRQKASSAWICTTQMHDFVSISLAILQTPGFASNSTPFMANATKSRAVATCFPGRLSSRQLSALHGQSGEMVLRLPQTSTFFRATYAGDIDTNGDGLTAWEERFLGTNDNNPDTDNDGIPDIWEYVHGLNPLVNDASADPDGDG